MQKKAVGCVYTWDWDCIAVSNALLGSPGSSKGLGAEGPWGRALPSWFTGLFLSRERLPCRRSEQSHPHSKHQVLREPKCDRLWELFPLRPEEPLCSLGLWGEPFGNSLPSCAELEGVKKQPNTSYASLEPPPHRLDKGFVALVGFLPSSSPPPPHLLQGHPCSPMHLTWPPPRASRVGFPSPCRPTAFRTGRPTKPVGGRLLPT